MMTECASVGTLLSDLRILPNRDARAVDESSLLEDAHQLSGEVECADESLMRQSCLDIHAMHGHDATRLERTEERRSKEGKMLLEDAILSAVADVAVACRV